MGTAVPVVLVRRAVPQVDPEQQTERYSSVNFVCEADEHRYYL